MSSLTRNDEPALSDRQLCAAAGPPIGCCGRCPGDLLATGELASCLPQLLEEGYSARSAKEHRLLIDASEKAKIFLPPDAEVVRLAVDLRLRLFAAGRGRTVGVSDLQIAATALRNTTGRQRVSVVHYDADLESLAAIEPAFSHRWIVPRGSVA